MFSKINKLSSIKNIKTKKVLKSDVAVWVIDPDGMRKNI